MNKIILVAVIAILAISCVGKKKDKAVNVTPDQQEVSSTYYLIRHAEKDMSNPSNTDPELTKEGRDRASEWQAFFEDKNIEAVYSTDFKRTMDTAQPTATANGLDIRAYNPSQLNAPNFQEETLGKNVLVVGHSNTTAQFANAILGRSEAPEIDESDYGNLYIVEVTNAGSTFRKMHFD